MSRNLNVGSAWLSVLGIFFVFGGIVEAFSLVPSEFSEEELLGVTLSQIRDFSPKLVDSMELAVQTRGLYMLLFGLFWSVISLVPYRNGEKWAWYALLVIGGIFVAGWLIVSYTGVTTGLLPSSSIPVTIILLILWMVGLALPAREILGKPSS